MGGQVATAHADQAGSLRRPEQAPKRGDRGSPGEYLFFLDGDDALAPRALEVLLQTARRNDSDVVLGKLAGVGRKTQVSVFAKDVDRAALPLAWSSLTASKLIRRSLVLANEIRFPEHMRVREDGHFVARCYLASTVISIVGSYVCHYAVRRRDGSSLTSEELRYDTVVRQGEEGIELLYERVAEQSCARGSPFTSSSGTSSTRSGHASSRCPRRSSRPRCPPLPATRSAG